MDSAELRSKTEIMLGSLSSQLTDSVFSMAESIALVELGLVLPIDNLVQQVWLVKRCRRHILDIFYTQSVTSVSHKQTKHDQIYDHYKDWIEQSDAEFTRLLESDPYIFAGVDRGAMFGDYVRAGFVYNMVGEDVTDLVKK